LKTTKATSEISLQRNNNFESWQRDALDKDFERFEVISGRRKIYRLCGFALCRDTKCS
jgi:hypothetical protein